MYIQAENQKPFFVTLNDKLYPSTGTGYVIIPKLIDTMYNFSVHFNNGTEEERFQCTVNKKDLGFSLKSFGIKGWGLQNIQSYATIMAGLHDIATTQPDTKKEEKAKSRAKSGIKREGSETASSRINKLLQSLKIKKSATKKIITSEKKQIIKAAEFVDDNGLNQLYIDILSKGMMDTVDVFIPYDKDSLQGSNKKSIDKANKKVLKARFNVNCTYQASGADFFTLRKKMASANSDDKMIEEAKKAFKVRCFTTQQIKNLSVLFLTEEGKYKFFDAIYPSVYDSVLFKSLESEFSDPYYLNRFRAMLK